MLNIVSSFFIVLLAISILFLIYFAILGRFYFTKKPSFVVIEKTSYYKLFVHLDTKLVYIVFGNSKEFTPVLSEDGTPYKYAGDLSSFKK